jgi:hypothetical protein
LTKPVRKNGLGVPLEKILRDFILYLERISGALNKECAMKPSTDARGDAIGALEKSADVNDQMMTALLEQAEAAQTYWVGMCRSISDFMAPPLMALSSIAEIGREKLEDLPLQDAPVEYQGF